MNIIDAHMHFSNIEAFKTAALEANVDYSYEGFVKECLQNNVQAAVCMGLTECSPGGFPDSQAETPMMHDLSSHIPPQMYLCPGINPHKLDDRNMFALRQAVKESRVVGLKIYAGYYHVDIYDDLYNPVYKLAEEFNIPVVIHCGDTYSENGILAYSHPLNADRLAVKFRGLNIVICHLGFPWIIDSCEVAYKNRNVYLDMSGLIIGGQDAFDETIKNNRLMEFHLQGLSLLNDYKKLLFGTDWPLTSMDTYIEFCKMLVPSYAHQEVFYYNAKRLFNL